MHAAAGSEQFGQLAGCFLTQRNKINRLAPGGRFLGATGRRHLADDRRQQRGRMLPADQVQALESLVDEVERVSGVGERPLGLGREQDIGQYSWRETGRRPTPQPSRFCAPNSATCCTMSAPETSAAS